MKRTEADLKQLVRIANKRYGMKLYLDRSAGGKRITAETEGGGERDLSPRGTTTEVAIWMEGFIEGFEQGEK